MQEVAVDIVQKMEPKEASNIFAEGMIPVVSVKEMQQIQIDEKADQFQMPNGCTMEAQLLDKPCQCSCSSNAMESPEQVKPKEPFSAPF
ncbi:hypothetical protein RJ641_019963 [Dillenia turbinata]|uniref:Uncharacterized protein n=1 Tax=Dillenia turbinata TaxID=194707 RepID=A0AAN8UP58_9MAGN